MIIILHFLLKILKQNNEENENSTTQDGTTFVPFIGSRKDSGVEGNLATTSNTSTPNIMKSSLRKNEN